MTKEGIDRAFTEMYEDLEDVGQGMIVKRGSSLCVSQVISEAYVTALLYNEKKKMVDKSHLRKFVVKVMRDSIRWPNSVLNKEDRMEICGRPAGLTDDDKKLAKDAGAEDWMDYQDKVNDHQEEVSARVMMEDYRKGLNDDIMLWLLDAYMAGKTFRELAIELDVSKDSAKRIMDKMKRDVKLFAESRARHN